MLSYFWEQKTSRGSSRVVMAAISKSAGISVGRSFRLCTARSTRFSAQRFLNFLGEHALGADLGKGDIGDFVAGRLDDLNLDLMSARFEQRLDVISLPERQLRSAGADAQQRH